MKAINKKAKKVMDVLTESINEISDSTKKIDNTKGAFLSVHVECFGKCNLGLLYSISHHYTQNGDLMCDPDMDFIKGGDGEYYPISFWQDAPIIRDEPVTWKDGEVIAFDPKRQAALATFANTWMRNIKEQQGLVI